MRVHVFSIFFTCFVYEAVALAINSNIAPTATSSTNSTKLHVAIYYESLCSDSMDFLTNQFAPAYDSLKDYMDVLFVPFGKAESENGGQNFFCQHGPAECTGNRLQSCVLDALDGDQDAKAKFVTCQMKWNAEYTGRRCADLVSASYPDVLKCSQGQRGIDLQLDAEKETQLIAKPYPSFIPTIVYNKRFNRSKQWRSLRDFKRIVCDELSSHQTMSDELSKTCGKK